jgi:hypothetical protein
VFLLFPGYGVWFVVRHPNQKLVMEHCFLDFLWLCDEDDVELKTVR